MSLLSKIFKSNLIESVRKDPTVNFSSGYLTLGSMDSVLAQLDYPSAFKAYRISEFINAYATVTPVSNAIDQIVDQFTPIEPKLFDTLNQNFINVGDVLKLLSDPNLFHGRVELMQNIASYFLATGNSYIRISVGANKLPSQIYSVSPLLVTSEQNSIDSYPETYTETQINSSRVRKYFRNFDAGKLRYVTEDSINYIFHIKNFTASVKSGNYEGVSKLNSLMYEISLFTLGQLFNRSMLKNQGRPSGLLWPRNSDNPFPAEKASEITQQIKNTLEGANNAGRIILLNSEMEFKELAQTARDMEYSELIKTVTEGIYNRFSIPLSLIQSSSLSLANMETALTQLYVRAVIPLLDRIYHELSNFLIPFYPELEDKGIKISYDKRDIDALSPLLVERLVKEKSLNVLSTNEVRAELNREPITNGDEVLAPANLVPIGDTPIPDQVIDEE